MDSVVIHGSLGQREVLSLWLPEADRLIINIIIIYYYFFFFFIIIIITPLAMPGNILVHAQFLRVILS